MPTAATEDSALGVLAALLGDPSPRPLHGSKKLPGLFAGATATDKAAARVCLDNHWLEPTGQFVGTGKSRKELVRITRAGVEAVLARADASQQLAGISAGLAQMAASATAAAESIRAEAVRLLEEFGASISRAMQPLEALAALPEMQKNLAQVLERVKPPDTEELFRRLNAASVGSAPTVAKEDWSEDVVRLVVEQKQANPFQRLTLPQVYERLRARHTDLTLGEFHDGLRRLHRAQRIRLGPYTQALATIDDGQNALYLDREVKYYVELP